MVRELYWYGVLFYACLGFYVAGYALHKHEYGYPKIPRHIPVTWFFIGLACMIVAMIWR